MLAGFFILTRRTTTALATVLVSSLIVFAGSAHAARPGPLSSYVRTDSERIAEVMRHGVKHSPSFGDLLATFDSLDRVIYVEEGKCRHRQMRACLQLVADSRNMLVRIDVRQTSDSVVAQLAHELYHALEIAREPDVVDAPSLRSFYSKIGERSCDDDESDCFETRAALAFDALVTQQLKSWHPVNAEDHATIVGSWKVISYDIEFQNSGERRPFLGAQPHGYLIFTPQGRVISYLEAEGRKALATDDECVDAYWTIVAYTGTYRLEGNTWITSVDGAWNVELVGTELERTFELKGNRLSVTSSWRPLRYDTRLSRVRLTFERED